jgi:hypothetical protein
LAEATTPAVLLGFFCGKATRLERFSERVLFIGNIEPDDACNHRCPVKVSDNRAGLSGQTMTFVSTKSGEEREASAKIADERKAAENAKAVLDCLIPSNARTNRIIFVLRNAANIARTATLTRLESKRVLDGMRTEAATSLNQTCSLLDRGGLTQEAINEATEAVTAWLNSLPRSKYRTAPQRPRVC